MLNIKTPTKAFEIMGEYSTYTEGLLMRQEYGDEDIILGTRDNRGRDFFYKVALVEEPIAESLLITVLGEAVKRIAKKVATGKKLTDSEVMILLLDQMNRRIEERFNLIETRLDGIERNFNSRFTNLEESFNLRFNDMEKRFNTRLDDLEKSFNTRLDSLKDYVDGRLNEMSKRIDDLSRSIHTLNVEVSSIKTDIIKLLKEKA